jgi:hypothetical protein
MWLFEREKEGANPHSGARYDYAQWTAKNATDLETGSYYYSTYRKKEDIPRTRNNWLCYDFKQKKCKTTNARRKVDDIN